MTAFHSTVGTLVIVGYLLLLLVNVSAMMRGRMYSWQQYVSYGAATLLLLQYLLGFSLLGEGESVSATHFIVALLAIVPLGLEHGYANTRESGRERALYGALANALTLAVVLIAYMIGQSN